VTEAQDAKPSVESDADASWQVDGADSSTPGSSEGLGDTVVKMPKVTARSAAVKPTMGAGKPPAAQQDGPKPSIPKPVRPTSGDDLMAAFDKPVAGSPASPKPVASSSPRPTVADPAPVAAKAAPVAEAAAVTSVSVSSVVRPPVKPVAPAASGAAAPSARRTRKARLRLSRVDPWSVMKTVFLFSIAFGIMAWVATYLLWQVLMASGLFSAINETISNAVSSPNNTEGWRIEDYFSANKVLGITALVAVINVVISTALGTVGAFLYNLSANILGGLELTLAED
jgi:hypothetical protein